MKPSLSIITPSFNQGQFIERTLKSVLDQGYPELEYIVVDGGSTDETTEVLERYSDQLAWWVSEPDRGQTHALNKGLARATGDIVAYINSDDFYLPGSFEAAIAGFSASSANWVVGKCRFVDDEGAPDSIWIPQLPRGPRYWWMIDPWGVPQAATFWRRSLFERYGRFREDMHYAFDTEFGLRLVYADQMPGIVEQEISVRYLHGAAKSADFAPFQVEIDRFVSLHKRSLSRIERVQLQRTKVLRRIGWYRCRALLGRLKRQLTGEPEPEVPTAIAPAIDD